MPGRTRGETRALGNASREYAHRYGLPLGYTAMVSMLETSEAINEIVRQHGAALRTCRPRLYRICPSKQCTRR